MMRKAILLLAIFLPSFALGQLKGQAKIDSFEREVPRQKEDTNKVLLLNKIAYAYRVINPDSGIVWAHAALQLAQRIKWERGEGIAYNSLYGNYLNKSDYGRAHTYALKSLEVNEKLGDKRSIAVNLGNIANIFQARSDYKTALSYQFRALKQREELNDKPLIATCLMNIGNIYLELGDVTKQLEYHSRALRINTEINDLSAVAECYLNMGSGYQINKDYRRALAFYEKSLAIFDSLVMKPMIATATGNMGDAYMYLKEYDTALKYNERSLELARELGDEEGIAFASAQIGRTYLQMAVDSAFRGTGTKEHYLKMSIRHLEGSLAMGDKLGNLRVASDMHNDLATAYQLTGGYKSALEHYQAHIRIRDSVFSTDNNVKIARLETQREADLKNKQIEINRLAEIKKRNEQLLLVGGLILLFIAVITVMRAHDRQKKANKEKEGLLQQKDMLVKEIHHRVKNNLQVISTLLDLQLENITDEGARDAMAESTTRVRSISLIHQHLYQHDDVASIEFARFADELFNQVSSLFARRSGVVSWTNSITPVELDIDTAVPLGLILNELLTNSYKYAFTDNMDASISVSLIAESGMYKLAYTDNGPGLPAGADTAGGGLGMRMMRSLSKQIGGKFIYNAADKAFIILFKDAIARKLTD